MMFAFLKTIVDAFESLFVDNEPNTQYEPNSQQQSKYALNVNQERSYYNQSTTQQYYNGTEENYWTRARSPEPVEKSYERPKPKHSTFHSAIVEYCMKNFQWKEMSLNVDILYVSLDANNAEYTNIQKTFLNTTKKKLYSVIDIQRMQNPYLMGQYLLTKQEMCHRNVYVGEIMMFHGTKQVNIEHICKDNFNWRLHGKKTGHRYGQGISFSPISYYASHYCDKSGMKVMLLCKVLVSHTCVGDESMVIPPYFDKRYKLRFDTSSKENNHVSVKYSDNEFYPMYKIFFAIKNIKHQ